MGVLLQVIFNVTGLQQQSLPLAMMLHQDPTLRPRLHAVKKELQVLVKQVHPPVFARDDLALTNVALREHQLSEGHLRLTHGEHPMLSPDYAVQHVNGAADEEQISHFISSQGQHDPRYFVPVICAVHDDGREFSNTGAPSTGLMLLYADFKSTHTLASFLRELAAYSQRPDLDYILYRLASDIVTAAHQILSNDPNSDDWCFSPNVISLAPIETWVAQGLDLRRVQEPFARVLGGAKYPFGGLDDGWNARYRGLKGVCNLVRDLLSGALLLRLDFYSGGLTENFPNLPVSPDIEAILLSVSESDSQAGAGSLMELDMHLQMCAMVGLDSWAPNVWTVGFPAVYGDHSSRVGLAQISSSKCFLSWHQIEWPAVAWLSEQAHQRVVVWTLRNGVVAPQSGMVCLLSGDWRSIIGEATRLVETENILGLVTDGNLLAVIDRAEHETLASVLHQASCDVPRRHLIAFNILKALRALHATDVVHGSLTVDTIRVSATNVVLLTYAGLLSNRPREDGADAHVQAPSKADDIQQLGGILTLMFAGIPGGEREAQFARRLQSGDVISMDDMLRQFSETAPVQLAGELLSPGAGDTQVL